MHTQCFYYWYSNKPVTSFLRRKKSTLKLLIGVSYKMNDDDKLIEAKSRLCQQLGEEGTRTYLLNLRMWFRKLWTKEQFDLECRKLFAPDQRHFHNEFFLALLNKITTPLRVNDTNASNNQVIVNGKRQKLDPSILEATIFEPISLFDYLPDENDELRPEKPIPQPRFAAQELFLPDTGLVFGRLLIAAWENGLHYADENISEMLVVGVQTLLKNILSAIIKTRKDYKTTGPGRFYYDVGCDYKHPFLKNSASRQVVDDHPIEFDKHGTMTYSILDRIYPESSLLTACETTQEKKIEHRITVVDLYHALKDKNLIPCHSVYANNLERVSQNLH